jgi:hypothetical protein
MLYFMPDTLPFFTARFSASVRFRRRGVAFVHYRVLSACCQRLSPADGFPAQCAYKNFLAFKKII